MGFRFIRALGFRVLGEASSVFLIQALRALKNSTGPESSTLIKPLSLGASGFGEAAGLKRKFLSS